MRGIGEDMEDVDGVLWMVGHGGRKLKSEQHRWGIGLRRANEERAGGECVQAGKRACYIQIAKEDGPKEGN